MNVFLDFEASSLGRDSYPIEAGWVFEDGSSESHLIHPASDWTDWSESAQAVHGIPRERLFAEGQPHDWVARRMVKMLSGHSLYASAPSWDGKWMSVLLRASAIPRHTLKLEGTDVARREAVRAVLGERPAPDFEALSILAQVGEWKGKTPPRHRALEDAKRELRAWKLTGRIAALRRKQGRVIGSPP